MTDYDEVGENLKGTLEQEFFLHQEFKNDDFLACLVPHPDDQSGFFGTKPLTVYVVGKPYGWLDGEFVWNDANSEFRIDLEERRTQIGACKLRFPEWKAVIYGDMGPSKHAQSMCPGSDAPRMMRRTIQAIQQMCTDTPGLEYGGTIEDQASAETFRARMLAWYGEPLYKIKRT